MNNQGFYGLLHKTILNLVLSQHHDAQLIFSWMVNGFAARSS